MSAADPSIDAIIADIDAALKSAGTPERANHEKGYLKSPLDHYGTPVPVIRRAAKAAWRAQGGLDRDGLRQVVGRLWASPVHELRMAAVVMLEQRVDLLEPNDLALVEAMIRASHTWAYVDTLAAKVAGPLVEATPALAAELDRWAADENFWVRRSAMLTLLMPLRRGEGDWERFVGYADAMLAENEFFIRKAIGWVLRETSKQRPALVRDYVSARMGRLSGLTFREATKRLPEPDRRALEAVRANALE